jgi:hypothetical protein
MEASAGKFLQQYILRTVHKKHELEDENQVGG